MFTEHYALLPLANVERQGLTSTWIASHDDPQFEIQGISKFAGQQVLITLDLAVHQPELSAAKIYFDCGDGLSEKNTHEFSRDEAGNATLVWAIPADIRSARLDPFPHSGEFRIKRFRIKPATTSALIWIATWKQIRHDPKSLFEKLPFAWRAFRQYGVRGLNESARIRLAALAQPTTPDARTYAQWVEAFEPHESTYSNYRLESQRWQNAPLISVLMPTYNTPIAWLREAVESVRAQTYEKWELCIADDASTKQEVRDVISTYAKQDARIRFEFRKQNGHISESSNSALALASGTYVALLDHDDLLHALALHFVAAEIVANPDLGLVYSDEDKVDSHNARYDPHFKCDFNYDLFLSYNMISHLGVYRTSLVRELGGFQSKFNGSQDHDLALRVIEKLADSQICHVPRVLYHWRAHRESTASAPSAKSYTHDATIAAVNAHLVRTGVNAEATSSSLAIGKCRVKYRLPDQQPTVDIIIPTRDQAVILKQCIDSIVSKTTYKNFRIRVIDNGSIEAETVQLFNSLKQTGNAEVIRDDSPFNYSALNNRAVASSTADFVCLLNNDIEIISPDWLSEMVSNAVRPDVGAVGARLWYPNDTLQHGGVVIGILGVAGHSHKHLRYGNDGYFSRPHLQQRFSAVTAACMLVRRSTFVQAGGLNELDLTIAFNDIDFCLKLGQLGKAIVWTPYADCYHHESVSRGYEDNPEKQARFAAEVTYMKETWRTDQFADRCYSTNLTLACEDFSLGWDRRVS